MCDYQTLPSRREHTLRKRRTRSARHFYRQALARAVLSAWRQLISDTRGFREVVQSVGQQMRLGLMAEALGGWRDVVRAKHWKTASMMRWAGQLWGWGVTCCGSLCTRGVKGVFLYGNSLERWHVQCGQDSAVLPLSHDHTCRIACSACMSSAPAATGLLKNSSTPSC